MTVKPQTLKQIVESLEGDIEELNKRMGESMANMGCGMWLEIAEVIQGKADQIAHLDNAIIFIAKSGIETDQLELTLGLRKTIKKGE